MGFDARSWCSVHRAYEEAHADIGINFITLRFQDPGKEKGFADSSSKGLVRFFFRVGLIYAVLMAVWLGLGDYSEQAYKADGDFELRIIQTFTDSFSCLGGMLLATVGCFRRCCSPTILESYIGFLFILLLVNAPFSERPFLARVLGKETEAEGVHAEMWLSLYIDCVVTIISLAPIRWSSVWPVYIFALLAFPVVRLVLYNETHVVSLLSYQTLTIALLIFCGIVGKRGLEYQDRLLFETVIHERTMRAQTEFVLSANNFDRRGRTARSVAASSTSRCRRAVSVSTSKVFDASDASSSIQSTLMRVKGAAERERWLIDPGSVSIFLSQMLGAGSFGAVFGGMYRGIHTAFKFSVELARGDAEARAPTLITELRVLRKLRHPNIVTFYGAVIDPPSLSMALVMELVMGCNLDSFVKRCRFIGLPIPDCDFYRLTCGITLALRYLHSHKPAIVHGDLKPENVLVEICDGAPPRPKLADFGLSRILSETTRDFGGTLIWMAPEVLQRDALHDTAIDVYGQGQMTHFMLSGHAPFRGWSQDSIIAALEDGLIPTPDCPDNVSELASALWQMGSSCIQVDPLERPPMETICDQLQQLLAQGGPHDELHALAREIWGAFDVDDPCNDSSKDSQNLDGADALARAPPAPVSWEAALQCLKKKVGGESSSELAQHDQDLMELVAAACPGSSIDGMSTIWEGGGSISGDFWSGFESGNASANGSRTSSRGGSHEHQPARVLGAGTLRKPGAHVVVL